MKRLKSVLTVISYVLSAVMLIALTTLFAVGGLSADKLDRIISVLGGDDSVENLAKKDDTSQEDIYFDYKDKMSQRESEIQDMEKKLNNLRQYTGMKVQELEKLNSELTSINKQISDKRAELQEFRDNWESRQKDRNFTLNLSRFSKMEPESVSEIMKMLRDDEVRLYLNNMKPAFVAEVIDVMRVDKDFDNRLDKILFNVKKLGNN